jgi:hypothetical protein
MCCYPVLSIIFLQMRAGDRILQAGSEHPFVRSGMVSPRGAQPVQPLSYDLRLPDEAQPHALRLLDASRAVINQALTALWPRLDAFMAALRSRLETGRRPPS